MYSILQTRLVYYTQCDDVAAQFEKKNTASGISSIAALSLGFSMSMSGASHILCDSDTNSNHKTVASPAMKIRSLLTSNDSRSSPKHSQRAFFAAMKKKSTFSSTLSSYGRRSSECSSMQTSFELQQEYRNGRKSLDVYLAPDERCESFSEGCSSYKPPPNTCTPQAPPSSVAADASGHMTTPRRPNHHTQETSMSHSVTDEQQPLLMTQDSTDINHSTDSPPIKRECDTDMAPPDYSDVVNVEANQLSKPTRKPVKKKFISVNIKTPRDDTQAPADTPTTPACANKRFLFANRSYPTIGKKRQQAKQPARFSESDTARPSKRKARRRSKHNNAQLDKYNDCFVAAGSASGKDQSSRDVESASCRKFDSFETLLNRDSRKSRKKSKVDRNCSQSDPLLDTMSAQDDMLSLNTGVCQSIQSLNYSDDESNHSGALLQDSHSTSLCTESEQIAHTDFPQFLETSLCDDHLSNKTGATQSQPALDSLSPETHIMHIQSTQDYTFV